MCPRPRTRRLNSMGQRRLVIELDIEPVSPDATAPTGWLRGQDIPPRRFESYVQLIGALHELRSAAGIAPESAQPGAASRPAG